MNNEYRRLEIERERLLLQINGDAKAREYFWNKLTEEERYERDNVVAVLWHARLYRRGIPRRLRFRRFLQYIHEDAGAEDSEVHLLMHNDRALDDLFSLWPRDLIVQWMRIGVFSVLANLVSMLMTGS